MVRTTTAARVPARRWTYADYRRIPDDGRRHEIIDGRHYVSPAPEPRHQAVVLGFAIALRRAIHDTGLGEVYVAPVDVHLVRGTLVQPDIFAVALPSRGIVHRTKVTGRPDLLVEVLSATPKSVRRDRRIKLGRYERARVREYLIVDPETRTVDQYLLVGNRYAPPRRCAERIELDAFPGVVIELDPVW